MELSIGIIVIVLFGVMAGSAQADNWEEYNGRTVLLPVDLFAFLSWQDALNFCRDRQAEPFIPHNAADFEWMMSVVRGLRKDKMNFPMSDKEKEGILKWTDGREVEKDCSFLKWHGKNRKSTDYAYLTKDGLSWFSGTSTYYPMICEYGAAPADFDCGAEVTTEKSVETTTREKRERTQTTTLATTTLAPPPLETCTVKVCPESNSWCYDASGTIDALCGCQEGYVLNQEGPATCHESCAVKTCAEANNQCYDAGGTQPAICVCQDGYVLHYSGNCLETCSIKSCPSDHSICYDGGGTQEAVCGCQEGYIFLEDTCLGSCSVYSCEDPNSVCYDGGGTQAAVCGCQEKYILVEGTCLESCEFKLCDEANSYCYDGDGTQPAVCACQEGYIRIDALCTETCALKTCLGPHSECFDGEGTQAAVCSCKPGYIFRNGACLETCDVKSCGGGNLVCFDAGTSQEAKCRCRPNYILTDGICLESCAIKACNKAHSVCYDGSGTKAAMCGCANGYVLIDGECVSSCSTSTICDFPHGVCYDAGGTQEARCGCDLGFLRDSQGRCLELCSAMTCPYPNMICNDGQEMQPGNCTCKQEYTLKNDTCVAVVPEVPDVPVILSTTKPKSSAPPKCRPRKSCVHLGGKCERRVEGCGAGLLPTNGCRGTHCICCVPKENMKEKDASPPAKVITTPRPGITTPSPFGSFNVTYLSVTEKSPQEEEVCQAPLDLIGQVRHCLIGWAVVVGLAITNLITLCCICCCSDCTGGGNKNKYNYKHSPERHVGVSSAGYSRRGQGGGDRGGGGGSEDYIFPANDNHASRRPRDNRAKYRSIEQL